MKKLFLISSIVLFSFSASAGLRCSKDYWGNITCTGTGKDSGYSSTTTEDYWGNQTTRDNRGNTTTCSKDYWGNVTCN